jgi:hypothetical protein
MVRNVIRGRMSVRAAGDKFRVCRATEGEIVSAMEKVWGRHREDSV